jgi:hypothetical protein
MEVMMTRKVVMRGRDRCGGPFPLARCRKRVAAAMLRNGS